MNNILLLLLVIPCFSGCSQNSEWHKYEIQTSIEIAIPITLELRGDESPQNEFMDGIRDEYNPNHVNIIGKSELIFQPTGTNALEKTALDDITRVLVDHIKINSTRFPEWNFSISDNQLKSVNQGFERQLLNKELETLPFANNIVDWQPYQKGEVNGLSYLNAVYISVVDGEKFYSETYQFFNRDEKVIITNSTGYSQRNKWIPTFDDVVKTFDFKNRK